MLNLNEYNFPSNLIHLEISTCGIENISFINDLENLEILKVSCNLIDGILDLKTNKL